MIRIQGIKLKEWKNPNLSLDNNALAMFAHMNKDFGFGFWTALARIMSVHSDGDSPDESWFSKRQIVAFELILD